MRFFLLIALFLIGNYSLYSQGILEQFKKAVEEKEFVEALQYAPEVVLQHVKDNTILMMVFTDAKQRICIGIIKSW